jgi:hypothetical protein
MVSYNVLLKKKTFQKQLLEQAFQHCIINTPACQWGYVGALATFSGLMEACL